MPLRAQFACLLGGLFALVVGASAYQYSHAQPGSNRPWPRITDSPDPYSEAAQRYEDLSRFDGIYVSRVEHRQRVMQKLRDGEITLFEAAADFKQMNRLPSPSNVDVLAQFAGASDNERVCRQVIQWLSFEMNELPPSQRQVVMQRVRAELRDHLARNGTVILPDE